MDCNSTFDGYQPIQISVEFSFFLLFRPIDLKQNLLINTRHKNQEILRKRNPQNMTQNRRKKIDQKTSFKLFFFLVQTKPEPLKFKTELSKFDGESEA